MKQNEVSKLKKEKENLLKKLLELTEKANGDLWRLKKELEKEKKIREELEAKNSALDFDAKKLKINLKNLQKKFKEKVRKSFPLFPPLPLLLFPFLLSSPPLLTEMGGGGRGRGG